MGSITIGKTLSTRMSKTMLEEMILRIRSEGLPTSLLKLLIASIYCSSGSKECISSFTIPNSSLNLFK